VAEPVDAPDLGSGARKGVGVRVPPLAPSDQAASTSTLTVSMLRPGLLPLLLPLRPGPRALVLGLRGSGAERSRLHRVGSEARSRQLLALPPRRLPAPRADSGQDDARPWMWRGPSQPRPGVDAPESSASTPHRGCSTRLTAPPPRFLSACPALPSRAGTQAVNDGSGTGGSSPERDLQATTRGITPRRGFGWQPHWDSTR
jgi:hypothetical protein